MAAEQARVAQERFESEQDRFLRCFKTRYSSERAMAEARQVPGFLEALDRVVIIEAMTRHIEDYDFEDGNMFDPFLPFLKEHPGLVQECVGLVRRDACGNMFVNTYAERFAANYPDTPATRAA